MITNARAKDSRMPARGRRRRQARAACAEVYKISRVGMRILSAPGAYLEKKYPSSGST
jgi:hypothetical protein